MMSPRSLLPLTLLLLVTPTNASTVEDNDATPVQLAQAYPMGEPIPAPPSVPRTAPPIPAAPSIPRKAPSIAPPPLAAGPAVAGPFEDGEAAFSKGDYATALRLWQPLAQQGDARAQNGLGALRIPTIATTHSGRSRPPVPIDRDQCGAGAVSAAGCSC